MLSFPELVALDGQLHDTLTLTLYLDGRSENPAWRTAWRRSLKQEEARLRRALVDAPHDEREAFSRDVDALESYMAQRRGALDAPGWLGVVADGEVRLDAPLRGTIPTLGSWGRGVALAPYLCSPDADDGAWVVVVDSRAARIFRCTDDSVHRIDTVRTTLHAESGDESGASRNGKSHPGTRGGVGRDAAERERRAARGRMLHELAQHVHALAPLAPVFVGGTPQLVGEAVSAIQGEGVTRVIEALALGARARVNEIARAVREGMAQLRRDADYALVEEVLRRFAADELGAAGAAACGRALDERSVQMLVLSETLVTAQPEVAEIFVRSAIAQDADIRVVTGDSARLLEESGGAGVLLRFSPFRAPTAAERELATV